MSIIALKATIVAGTGTGKSFDAYKLTGDLATYREVGAVGPVGFVQMKRTEPKPTKDYGGVSRGEVKLTRQIADANGILRPVIVRVDTSLPTFMTDAQRVAVVEEGLLLALDSASREVLAKQLVPQS